MSCLTWVSTCWTSLILGYFCFSSGVFPKAGQGAGVGTAMQRLVRAAALLGQIARVLEGQHEMLQFVSPRQRVI